MNVSTTSEKKSGKNPRRSAVAGSADELRERGASARTRRLMLETATRLMQGGATPSVSEVAEAAEVSRATAYRYFPSQAALVHAVVHHALGPILSWESSSDDARARVGDLFDASFPRLDAFEATFKAALKVFLDERSADQPDALYDTPELARGHRIDLLNSALEPLRGELPDAHVDRLAQALSLMFGIETFIVLKDIWGLDGKDTQAVAQWAACALVDAAIRDAQGGQR